MPICNKRVEMEPWVALAGYFRLDKQKVRKMHLQNTDLPQTVVLWIAGQLVSQNTCIFQCLFMIKCLWFKHSGDQVKKTEMGRTCGTYEGEKRWIQGFSGETWGKETTWKTQA
jgi:hypothetical protein